MATHYNLENIRTLLTEGFSEEELRSFCFDRPDFRPVHNQLSEGTGKSEIVRRLMEYADQKELFGPLLAWAKEQNSAKYRKHQPYNHSTPHPTISSGDYGKSERTCFVCNRQMEGGFFMNIRDELNAVAERNKDNPVWHKLWGDLQNYVERGDLKSAITLAPKLGEFFEDKQFHTRNFYGLISNLFKEANVIKRMNDATAILPPIPFNFMGTGVYRLPIPFDIMDMLVGKYVGGFGGYGWCEFERELLTNASIVYKLSQHELGCFGTIKIYKINDKESELDIAGPSKPSWRNVTPEENEILKAAKKKGRDEFLEEAARVSNIISAESDELYHRKKQHYTKVLS